MSLPDFSTQAELFSTAGLSASLFAQTDRYRLFAKLVYPALAAARSALEKCYCTENGRVALEPVLMLGTSLLQFLDGVPDRQAVEMLRYHAGWNFALNRQLGDEVFHPSSLVNFRNRLEEHQQSALGFTIILEALAQAGLVSRQSRQRLDSTQIFGRVAKMSRLDCMRETLRLALKELEGALAPETRPNFWLGLWERYVESQTDYRAGSETLARKLAETGTDAWQLLEWLRQPEHGALAAGEQAQLLVRVFAEQFEIRAGQAVAAPKETIPLAASSTPAVSEGLEAAAPTSVEAPAPQAQGAPGDCRADQGWLTHWAARGGPNPGPRYGEWCDDPAQGQTATGFRPRAKSARAGSDLRGQGPGRAQKGACGLQGAGGRDGVRGGVGAGRADPQFHHGHGDPSGL